MGVLLRSGRRPDDRHDAVIFDLFGKMVGEEDRTYLLWALRNDEERKVIVLQLQDLHDLSDQSACLLRSLHLGLLNKGKRLVIVHPQDKVSEVLNKHSNGISFDVVEDMADAFKPPDPAG